MRRLCLVVLLLIARLLRAEHIEVQSGRELALRYPLINSSVQTLGSTRASKKLHSAASNAGAVQSLAQGIRRSVDRLELEDACRPYRLAGMECEPNIVFHSTNTSPNDTSYSKQWGASYISLPGAWDLSGGSQNVIVAVVDTGIDYSHPDLISNIVHNSGEIADNHIDDDRNGYVDDYNGYDFVADDEEPRDLNNHGTHVSGIIGAMGNNSRGVCGVNWQVGLLAVRVLDENGSGVLSDVVSGIDYAISRGANVINLSLGATSGSNMLRNSIIRALNAGILIVVAAGNEGSNNDVTPTYPASYRYANIMSVAAINSEGKLSSFSNYGAHSVDIAAPGQSILSTITTSSGSYGYMSGTSMAAPHVSGLAALVQSVNPALDMLQIRELLLSSAQKLPALASKTISGGVIDAYSVVLQASANQVSAPPAALTLRVSKQSRTTATISGKLFNAITSTGVPNQSVELYCAQKLVKQKRSAASGRVSFGKIKKSSRTLSCFARYGDTLSATVRVSKRR